MQYRLFSSAIKTLNHNKKWSIKQVTKPNFSDAVEELKSQINSSDFIAVSFQTTGSFAATWHRVSPFDTPQTAYLKAKHAADRFQILQFAVCPFSVHASSKITAHPYNFHLFPRDEMKLGMPSYSFSCQVSNLMAMAREGFDFNACIYEGISYLSRAQESVANFRGGNPVLADSVMKSSSPPSVADSIFIERTRYSIKYWKKTCTQSSSNADDALVISLRKLVMGNQDYGGRPSMNVDVCSERQVQLVLEILLEFSDELVPLLIPAKGGGTQAVRVVLMSSNEDKDVFKRELQDLQAEQNRRVRGFREVIDLISASQKPLISQNSLNDFTFLHSKFIAPLPPNIDEFISSMNTVFPQVLDVNYLMKEISPLRRVNNIHAALSYLKNRFFAPVDMEISNPGTVNQGQIHGHNVTMICQLFVKLCSILKIDPTSIQSSSKFQASAIKEYANFSNSYPVELEEPVDQDVQVWTNNTRKVSCENLVFLWGFGGSMSAGKLKSLLQGSHKVFVEEFDVRFVDKSCAIVVFWQPGFSETFLNLLNSEQELSGPLKDIVAEGLRAGGYETYKRACKLGLWGTNLADSLDKAIEAAVSDCQLEADSNTKSSEIYWCSESVINFDDL